MGIIDRLATALWRVSITESRENSSGVVMAQLISVTEAAKQSGVTVGYIRRMLIEGRIKGQKIGTFWAIDSRELARFIARPRRIGRPPLDKR